MKRLHRRYLHLYFFGVLLVSVLFFLSCQKKQEEESIKIGVSIANFDDRFMSYIKSGMMEYEEALGSKVEVVYLDAKFYDEKQKQQVKYFIREGMDAIIVIPVSTKKTSKMTEAAVEAEVPLIYLNIFPDEFTDKELPAGVYYVGSKEIEAGMIQMEYLAEILKGKGKVAVLMGELDTSASQQRTAGVELVAKKYPGIKIVEKRTAKWLRPLASSVVEDWLDSGKEFDVIAANNDEMAIGAVAALEKYGKLDSVMVVGVDATQEAIEELVSGGLTATVLQDAKQQGEKALEVAIESSSERPVRQNTWIPFRLVTLENYEEFQD